MDNQNTNQSLFALHISDNTKMQLKGAAVLAGIAAILSLVNQIISFVMVIMNKNKVPVEYRTEGFSPTTSAEKAGSIVGGVITLIIGILLFYFLNKFSTQTKAGLNGNNQEVVNNGLSGLSAYFVTLGILLIIGLAFGLLVVGLAGSRS